MRRHSKKNVVLAVLLIIGGLYFISHSNFLIAGPARPQEPIPNELTWQTERLVSKESWVEQGDYLPLNVTYQLLAGAPSTQQSLKRNYNDAPERVSFRSKQNLDYSFLIHYSASLGRYYLQLEDDVSSAKNFLSTIRRRVEEQEAKKTTWAMLEFSALGYIGKLYKSTHLPLLARFLFLFYQEMPCDWLMTRFRELMTQKETIIFKPSLFQHMGTFSSFQGTYNKLKDKDFEEGLYTNPLAEVYSDMSTYKNQFPKLAWEPGEGFFWGRSPEKGNHLTVVFTDPTVVTGVYVETGSGGKDLLESAQVELGHDVITTEKEEKSCKEFQSVGTLENGKFEMQDVDKRYGSASSCLRIQVTAAQKDWVIIKKIRISTKLSTPSRQA
ncbi:alpha-1,3-mannosyl-glycoprotein 4-beta-N-acetylglucosaminyltransferase C-like isoform X2 [Sander lucioperca]|uniref:alpha-1,3-mannosyl-glycoprotein 4-beta-N-acetylglucosaminyltransferase C-like isoform X2 n=1 Tax=Sander lucioperca TaxID=283035 RepID=UPI00125CDC87|nr:alpha-1,3-mannosyl-glycoprotein 4-beta-N-acetylglucosaminyltransferase C-like isoform X2 [Sander lucioperca]